MRPTLLDHIPCPTRRGRPSARGRGGDVVSAGGGSSKAGNCGISPNHHLGCAMDLLLDDEDDEVFEDEDFDEDEDTDRDDPEEEDDDEEAEETWQVACPLP
jgi:hypothetical protein